MSRMDKFIAAYKPRDLTGTLCGFRFTSLCLDSKRHLERQCFDVCASHKDDCTTCISHKVGVVKTAAGFITQEFPDV